MGSLGAGEGDRTCTRGHVRNCPQIQRRQTACCACGFCQPSLTVPHSQVWRLMRAGGWRPQLLSVWTSPCSFSAWAGLGFRVGWWPLPKGQRPERDQEAGGRSDTSAASLEAMRGHFCPLPFVEVSQCPLWAQGEGRRHCLLVGSGKDWKDSSGCSGERASPT